MFGSIQDKEYSNECVNEIQLGYCPYSSFLQFQLIAMSAELKTARKYSPLRNEPPDTLERKASW